MSVNRYNYEQNYSFYCIHFLRFPLRGIQGAYYIIRMKKTESYNESIAKLRAIVSDIENGELDVDILSEKVKEASRLIKICKDKLYKADEEVKKILEELQ